MTIQYQYFLFPLIWHKNYWRNILNRDLKFLIQHSFLFVLAKQSLDLNFSLLNFAMNGQMVTMYSSRKKQKLLKEMALRSQTVLKYSDLRILMPVLSPVQFNHVYTRDKSIIEMERFHSTFKQISIKSLYWWFSLEEKLKYIWFAFISRIQ